VFLSLSVLSLSVLSPSLSVSLWAMVAAAVIGEEEIKRRSRIKIGTGLGMVPVRPSTIGEGCTAHLRTKGGEGGVVVVVVMVMVTAMVGSM